MKGAQAELGELPGSLPLSQSLRGAGTGPYPSLSSMFSVCPAPPCKPDMLSSLRPGAGMEVEVALDQWREERQTSLGPTGQSQPI